MVRYIFQMLIFSFAPGFFMSKIHYSLGKLRICWQCRRPEFNPWVGKIPLRRERLPTPVFWHREFHGLYSLWGRKESDTTERLSVSMCARLCSKFWVSSNEKDSQDLCSGSYCLGSYILRMRRKQRDDKSIKKMYRT